MSKPATPEEVANLAALYGMTVELVSASNGKPIWLFHSMSDPGEFGLYTYRGIEEMVRTMRGRFGP